jgi:hypothetical protein
VAKPDCLHRLGSPIINIEAKNANIFCVSKKRHALLLGAFNIQSVVEKILDYSTEVEYRPCSETPEGQSQDS